MTGKRKRPTRQELDERLRNVLDRIPATIAAPQPEPPRVEPRQWTRIVSGRIAASTPALDAEPHDLDAAANG